MRALETPIHIVKIKFVLPVSSDIQACGGVNGIENALAKQGMDREISLVAPNM